jgi:hypothetical protein
MQMRGLMQLAFPILEAGHIRNSIQGGPIVRIEPIDNVIAMLLEILL